MSAINKTFGQNMLLVTSYWGNADTFKLIPVTLDCPYSEVIYDPSTTLLVVISKVAKENFNTVPRLDTDGNPIKAKKPKTNGTAHQEQRIILNTLTEYYIPEKEEQDSFIEQFAVNAKEFDRSKFHRDMAAEDKAAVFVPEKQGLVGEDGKPLKQAKKTSMKKA